MVALAPTPTATATPTPAATATPTVTLMPSPLDFAAIAIGQVSHRRIVTLSNESPNAITVRGATIGRDYLIVGNPCPSTLPAFQSCNYGIASAPRQQGARNETFRVTLSSGSALKVALHGVGKP